MPTDAIDQASETGNPYQANEPLIAWVDLLNVRAEPATNAKVIASLRESETVTFTGERTDVLLKLDLRGQTFEEPWLKVKTPDGKEGWIFGGAVKRQGEDKGVKRSSMSVGELTHLQLGQWTKGTEWKSAAGDAENVTALYTNGELTLALKKTEVGEYGYMRDYELFGEKIDFSGEWRAYLKEELKRTMMAMDRIPTQARIESIGTVGMGTRGDFSDLWNEAVEEANRAGKQDDRLRLCYQNSKYDCLIEATQVGQNDGGGGKYEGEMQILAKDGKLLYRDYVYGECGC